MRRLLLVPRLRHLIPWCFALVLSIGCLTIVTDGYARPTAAQRSAARKHANNGRDLFNEKKYAESIEEFRAAQKLVQAPPHLLYIARALSELGKLLEARQTYQQIVDEELAPGAPGAFQKAQSEAGDELAALDERIPKITIAIEGPAPEETSISIDGVPVASAAVSAPLPLDPGEHDVTAEAEGYETTRESFELAEGEGTVDIRLVLPETTGAQPDETDQRPIEDTRPEFSITYPPFILMGAGVLVLGVGGVTGGLALGKASELKDACPQNPCPTENESLKDDANMLATVSTVSFVVGGLAVGAGAGWLIWDLTMGSNDEGDGADTTGRWVRPFVGPATAGVHGRF